MSTSGNILIIDDEATLRQSLARILKQAGFEVMIAETAEQGISYISTTMFDLVFMDLRMPGMNGLEALKIISASYPALPIVLLTAQPDLNSAVEALRNGATDYLLKPVKPEKIIESARKLIDESHKERRKSEILQQIEKLQLELKGLPRGDTKPPLSNNVDLGRYVTCGKLALDMHKRCVVMDDKVINIPSTTFDYLHVLAKHSPDVVAYQTLVAEAQGFQADLREAQELAKWHIHQLRHLLGPSPQGDDFVINIRSKGYRLIAD